MATMIDTLKFARNFETAGFAKPQAEALTAALAEMSSVAREDLVTKTDLRIAFAELRSEMAELRGELKSEIAEFRSEFKGDLQVAIAQLRSEIVTTNATTRSQLLWTTLGSQGFLLASLIALSRFTDLFK